MNWGKVIYIFFALMSLTTTAEFLYDKNEICTLYQLLLFCKSLKMQRLAIH